MGSSGENTSGVDRMTPEERARAAGFSISHAAGCGGVHFPGIGIVWDRTLPDEEKHAAIDRILTHLKKSSV